MPTPPDARPFETAAERADVQVFRRYGEYWTIIYNGETLRLRDLLGLRHLRVLLSHPDTEISALALERGSIDPTTTAGGACVQLHDARERARINVTRAISTALRRIAVHHPELGRHLERTIHTGTFCSYSPDPRLPIIWQGAAEPRD